MLMNRKLSFRDYIAVVFGSIKDAPIDTVACAARTVINQSTASKTYKDIFPD